MEPTKRLVVFTGDLNYTVRRNIVELDLRIPGLSWLVVVHEPSKPLSRRLKNLRTNLRKNGWRWIPYQINEAWSRLRQGEEPLPQRRAPGAEYEAEHLAALDNVRIVRTKDIHSPATCREILEFQSDLGLSLAAPILKPSVFNLPKQGTINLHKGRLPGFRGMPPAFWELWTDQDEVGCSVHRVNERLDEGDLLAESSVQVDRYSDQRGLQLRLDEIGVELVCDVAKAILTGTSPEGYQPPGEGKTWRKPTLAQQSELRRRLERRGPARQAGVKLAAKDGFARCLLAWHQVLGWRLATPRITVLLYHRVSDQVRDNLTVGIAQFERQMRLLRQTCDLLSLEDLLAIENIPHSKRPLVAVSFDDGYLDNFENAAPILRRCRVPCSFFVSTALLGSEKQFPHDIVRGNPLIPTMSWSHLRSMKSWGFTIGSHTANHIDCVAEAESVVREELRQSSDRLRHELGVTELFFAYPYGGRNQMNDERRSLVRESGFRACLSAFGGSNIGRVDRWDVRRRGISWEFTEATFLQQTLGYGR